jgi:hypothetical protein
MRGLDPRIHDEAQIQNSCDSDRLRCLFDCRVKPGNDRWRRWCGTSPAMTRGSKLNALLRCLIEAHERGHRADEHGDGETPEACQPVEQGP